MSETHIKVLNVHKVYPLGNTQMIALRGVSFEVMKGDFLSLSGSSGSGKTTLLNLLGGLDTPTQGEIYLGQQKLSGLNEVSLSAFRAHKLGFIFQTFNILPVLSAVENVEYPLLKTKFSKRERREIATEALNSVGLGKFLFNRPYQLSGGQRQRVAIARAVVHKPELVIADEPTANLDKQTAREVLDLLSELNQRLGITLIVATHDPEVIARTRSTLHISDGRLEKK